MDPCMIHSRLLAIVAVVNAKPMLALPNAMPIFTSHPLRQAELELLGVPFTVETSDG